MEVLWAALPFSATMNSPPVDPPAAKLTMSQPNLDRTTGGVRNLGYLFNRAVPYAPSAAARGRRTTESTWAPLRLDVRHVATANGRLDSFSIKEDFDVASILD